MRKTRIAVLGTLADLHQEPIHYNLACLACLVEELHPDLLSIEVQRVQWESGDWSRTSPEYREALIPLADRTDIVIVPIQGQARCDLAVPGKGPVVDIRQYIAQLLDGLLRALQRLVDDPKGINSSVFGHACSMICGLQGWACGASTRARWQAANRELLENVLEAVQRDPGTRMLVTVDCRRRHQLVRRLHHSDEVEVVDFWKL